MKEGFCNSRREGRERNAVKMGCVPIFANFCYFNQPKMIKKIFIVLLIVSCMLIVYINVDARVTGNCANCHTMHNSQNGSVMSRQLNSSYTGYENDTTPNATLLISDCLGCHSSTNSNEAISSIGVPIVFSTSGPQFGFDDGTYKHGLAGGNFYWVRTDDTKGHNVFSDNPDNNLSGAPGKSGGCGGPGPGSSACHVDLSNTTSGLGFSTPRQGCTKCHMIGNSTAPVGYHHLDDTGPIIDSAAEGWYRFLDGHMAGAGHGASGIEDSDWQASYGLNDHNEYLGYSADKGSAGGFSAIGDVMTGFCCGCHGNFHIEQSGSAWIRHPSDAVIPNSGEYSAYTTYDPQAPVARPNLSAISDSSQVQPGTDMVMCLSCHRPHGSPYPDMLRWDYSNMVAGGSGSGGCFTCHTRKNQAP